jgi:hypothetical protein
MNFRYTVVKLYLEELEITKAPPPTIPKYINLQHQPTTDIIQTRNIPTYKDLPKQPGNNQDIPEDTIIINTGVAYTNTTRIKQASIIFYNTYLTNLTPSPNFKALQYKELQGLLNRGVFRVINKADILLEI